ncbi:hypothetical protein WS68_24620 [Burkholderia sp. TSV86]|nr:hypothetical protein WS68_24620 [Burkholderia sp. TSV86]
MVLTLIALAISYNRPTVARTRPKHVSILLERVAVQQAAAPMQRHGVSSFVALVMLMLPGASDRGARGRAP